MLIYEYLVDSKKINPMKKFYYLLAVCVLAGTVGIAQSSFAPVSVEYGTFLGETIPLRDYPTVVPGNGIDGIRIIPNNMRTAPKTNPDALPLGPDPLAQVDAPFRAPQEILQNFDGINLNEGGAIPPDPTGAAGPNHYVHAVNLVIKIFDKTGNLLVGPTTLGSFLGNGSSNGDPIVMYDQLADRFFVSQFQTSNDALIVGVSTTPDPTGTYNVYSFPLNAFPDYPHYSVWPDAYYLTANKFVGNTTYALDRAAIIAGAGAPAIIGFNLPGVVSNPNTVFSPEPANLLGTTFPAGVPGYIVYLQDDAWGGVAFDHLKVWEIDIDFVTPGNSTISAPDLIALQPFDGTFFPFGTGDIRQPSTTQRIDAISGVISYMANYRSFAGHNSWLINFNVDIDGSNTSGIRWIELRNTGTGPWSVFQEGTWTLPDGESRFMGSMAMDINGNIALAYNIGSENTNVGIRFTGRLDGDPAGLMSFEEQIIQDGVSRQSTTNRFGDYAQMTMDPDGVTFWHTAEYFRFHNNWQTKVAAFNLDNLPILGGAEARKDEAEMAVYPLSGGVYEVFLNSTKDLGNVQYEILDIQGRKVSQGVLNNSGETYRSTFNKGSMAIGVYVVRAFNNSNFNQSKKVVIK